MTKTSVWRERTSLLCIGLLMATASMAQKADSIAMATEAPRANGIAMAATQAPQADSIDIADPTIAELTGTADPLTHEDSLKLVSIDKTQKKAKTKRDWANWAPNPKRALWLAIVLPGAGQIYNRKFWKLPIVYGGLIGCVYAMTWNNQMYRDYSQAYLDISDNDPNTASYNSFLHLGATINDSNKARYTQIFKSRKDTYRRYRDLSFFCMLGVYALSIIDAYVDASLSKFDISNDLSLRLQPAVITTQKKGLSNTPAAADDLINNSGVGVQGALTF